MIYAPPSPAKSSLRAAYAVGGLPALLIVLWALLVGASGLLLTMAPWGWGVHLVGVVILACNMVQWFIIMHECGHSTHFAGRHANTLVGTWAGLVCGVPFLAWKLVHHDHHTWTGWKDRDPTTSQVAPREHTAWQEFVLNTCWRTGFPLFALLYRLNNFWHLPRLHALYPGTRAKRGLSVSLLMCAGSWLMVASLAPHFFTTALAPAYILSLMLSEPIMLSQHTHVPQLLAGSERVRPFPPSGHEAFTRSLVFPRFVSRLWLFNFDFHELHHMHPRVPGYHLHKIPYQTANAIPWWEWFKRAHSLSATDFLFKNREQTGVWL